VWLSLWTQTCEPKGFGAKIWPLGMGDGMTEDGGLGDGTIHFWFNTAFGLRRPGDFILHGSGCIQKTNPTKCPIR
jgi:hypothetical protein